MHRAGNSGKRQPSSYGGSGRHGSQLKSASRTHLIMSAEQNPEQPQYTGMSGPGQASGPGVKTSQFQVFTARSKMQPHPRKVTELRSEVRKKERVNHKIRMASQIITPAKPGERKNGPSSLIHQQDVFHRLTSTLTKHQRGENVAESSQSREAFQQSHQKVLSGILSDSERKHSRKPRGSIAWNLEKDSEPKQHTSQRSGLESMTTPHESMFKSFVDGNKNEGNQQDTFSLAADKHLDQQVQRAHVKKKFKDTMQDTMGTLTSNPALKMLTTKDAMMTIDSRSSEQDSTNRNTLLLGPTKDILIEVTDENLNQKVETARALKTMDQDGLNGLKDNFEASREQLMLPGLTKNRAMSVRAKPGSIDQTAAMMAKARSSFRLDALKSRTDALSPGVYHSAQQVAQRPGSRNIQLRNSASGNEGETRLTLDAQGPTSHSAFSKQQQLVLSDEDRSPQTGKSALERKLQRVEGQISLNKMLFDQGEIQQHLFKRGQDKLLKEKLDLRSRMDQQQRTKQYLKERDQQRKEKKMPDTKLTVHFYSPKVAKVSARKPQEKKVKSSERKKAERPTQRLRSFEQLKSLQDHTQSQPQMVNISRTSKAAQVSNGNVLQSAAAKSGFGLSKKRGSAQFDSVGIKSREQGGSTLFKTQEVGKTGTVMTELLKGRQHLQTLSLDTHELKKLQKIRKQRGVSQPQGPTSLMDDLQENWITDKLPDKVNPLSKKRAFQTGSMGSSFPNQLKYVDKDGEQVQNLKKSQNPIQVIDIENSQAESMYSETVTNNTLKKMHLAKETKRQNKFLSQIQNEHARLNKDLNDKLSATIPQGGIHSLTKPTDLTATTDSMSNYDTDAGGKSSQINLLTNVSGKSKTTAKNGFKQSFQSFENQIQQVTMRGNRSTKTNMNILHLIGRPESTLCPDFSKIAIQAQQNEIKTLQYELKRFMNSQAAILALDVSPPWTFDDELLKNEMIELLPRVNIVCKVTIKERVAPLKLKFEFFDSESRQRRTVRGDTIICLSQTNQCPTLNSCERRVTDIKRNEVCVFMGTKIKGKVFPEFTTSQRKEKAPQQVYISMQSMTGCHCTVTASFPKEVLKRPKKEDSLRALEERPGYERRRTIDKARAKPKKEESKAALPLTKQQEFFNEFMAIESVDAVRKNYRELYKRKAKFIQEEIQRCTDLPNYVPEVMLRAEKRRKQLIKERLNRVREEQEKRSEGEKESLALFVERHQNRLSASSSSESLFTELGMGGGGESPVAKMLNPYHSQSQKDLQLSSPQKKLLRIERQKFKREIKMQHAATVRKQQYEEKQKRRMLFVVKQDLVAAYKKDQIDRMQEELRIKDLAHDWIYKIYLFKMIMFIHESFLDKKERHERALKEFYAKVLIVKNAHRFFSNGKGEFGRSIEDRTRLKISNSMLHLFFLSKDQAQINAKERMKAFMQSWTTRMALSSRIQSIGRSSVQIPISWRFQTHRFRLLQIWIYAQLFKVKQDWAKKVMPKSSSKSLAQDQKDLLQSFQMLDDNIHIVQKNLKLFAQLINQERILRNIQLRIEIETIEATQKLLQLQKEEREAENDPHSTSELSEDDDFPRGSESSIGSQQEIEKNQPYSRRQQRMLRALMKRRVPADESRRQRVKREKKDTLAKLRKLQAWRDSPMLQKIEAEYERIVKEATTLDNDRQNFSFYCWRGMEGEEEIQRANKMFKSKLKQFKDKKEKVKTLKQAYTKGLANTTTKAFRKWINQRRDEFNHFLTNTVPNVDPKILKRGYSDRIKQNYGYNRQQLIPVRVALPQELAFMYMKIQEDISIQNKKSKKTNLKENSRRETFSGHRDNQAALRDTVSEH